MVTPRPVVIDFETEPIEERPHYPPKPVGVSIRLPSDKVGKYYAFGHPTGNNCSEKDALRAFKAAVTEAKQCGVLCHHGKFDLDLGEVWSGMPIPPWHLCHDTLFLLFLNDPYSPSLALKPAAERLLGIKPSESDALREWAIANKLMPKNAKEYGHLICKMPGDLVGKYANGDTLRTKKIFEKVYPLVIAAGMGEAYDRERRLMPILLKNEREGIYANKKLLASEDAKYSKAMADSVAWVGKTLKAPGLNLDSPKEVLLALKASGKVDEDKLLLTPGGEHSASKDSLLAAVKDKKLLSVMQYQSKLATALNTFIKPWRRQAEATGATVHPSWNQVRTQGSGGNDAGAKTGRLSAARFLNAPKPYKEEEGKYEHPRFKGLELPELPIVRKLLVPDPGEVWLRRDYSQQELRVLGHFEDGSLLNSFIDDFHGDQTFDVHQMAGDLLIERFGLFNGDRMKARVACKTIGFGLIYGMGKQALAERLDVSVQDSVVIIGAYLELFPGLGQLKGELSALGRAGNSMKTWGGRVYFTEEPKFIAKRGRLCSFEYRLLNFLIQGSSADCTKEAAIRYDGAKKHGRFLVLVHDEDNISVPKPHLKAEAQLLREVMASIEFDSPMLSGAEYGTSWGDLKPMKESRLLLPGRYT